MPTIVLPKMDGTETPVSFPDDWTNTQILDLVEKKGPSQNIDISWVPKKRLEIEGVYHPYLQMLDAGLRDVEAGQFPGPEFERQAPVFTQETGVQVPSLSPPEVLMQGPGATQPAPEGGTSAPLEQPRVPEPSPGPAPAPAPVSQVTETETPVTESVTPATTTVTEEPPVTFAPSAIGTPPSTSEPALPLRQTTLPGGEAMKQYQRDAQNIQTAMEFTDAGYEAIKNPGKALEAGDRKLTKLLQDAAQSASTEPNWLLRVAKRAPGSIVFGTTKGFVQLAEFAGGISERIGQSIETAYKANTGDTLSFWQKRHDSAQAAGNQQMADFAISMKKWNDGKEPFQSVLTTGGKAVRERAAEIAETAESFIPKGLPETAKQAWWSKLPEDLLLQSGKMIAEVYTAGLALRGASAAESAVTYGKAALKAIGGRSHEAVALVFGALGGGEAFHQAMKRPGATLTQAITDGAVHTAIGANALNLLGKTPLKVAGKDLLLDRGYGVDIYKQNAKNLFKRALEGAAIFGPDAFARQLYNRVTYGDKIDGKQFVMDMLSGALLNAVFTPIPKFGPESAKNNLLDMRSAIVNAMAEVEVGSPRMNQLEKRLEVVDGALRMKEIEEGITSGKLDPSAMEEELIAPFAGAAPTPGGRVPHVEAPQEGAQVAAGTRTGPQIAPEPASEAQVPPKGDAIDALVAAFREVEAGTVASKGKIADSGRELAPPGAPKEPWEMTRDEFQRSFVFRGLGEDNETQRHTYWGSLQTAQFFAGSNWDMEATRKRGTVKSRRSLALLRNENVPRDLTTEEDGTRISPHDWVKKYGEIKPYAQHLLREGKVDQPRPDFLIPEEGVNDPHRYLVEKALSEGKFVPRAVLAELQRGETNAVVQGTQQEVSVEERPQVEARGIPAETVDRNRPVQGGTVPEEEIRAPQAQTPQEVIKSENLGLIRWKEWVWKNGVMPSSETKVRPLKLPPRLVRNTGGISWEQALQSAPRYGLQNDGSFDDFVRLMKTKAKSEIEIPTDQEFAEREVDVARAKRQDQPLNSVELDVGDIVAANGELYKVVERDANTGRVTLRDGKDIELSDFESTTAQAHFPKNENDPVYQEADREFQKQQRQPEPVAKTLYSDETQQVLDYFGGDKDRAVEALRNQMDVANANKDKVAAAKRALDEILNPPDQTEMFAADELQQAPRPEAPGQRTFATQPMGPGRPAEPVRPEAMRGEVVDPEPVVTVNGNKVYPVPMPFIMRIVDALKGLHVRVRDRAGIGPGRYNPETQRITVRAGIARGHALEEVSRKAKPFYAEEQERFRQAIATKYGVEPDTIDVWGRKIGKNFVMTAYSKSTDYAPHVIAHELGHHIAAIKGELEAGGKVPGFKLDAQGRFVRVRPGKANILDMLSSVFSYGEDLLREYPSESTPRGSAPGDVPTLEERQQWWQDARNDARKPDETIILEREEEIRREYGVTPDDLKAIWNDVEGRLKVSPDLYNYVSELTNREKADIARSAMRGQVPETLKQFARVVMEKTGKVIQEKVSVPGREGTNQEIYDKFNERLDAEIRKRRLFVGEQLRAELRDVSQEMDPFDPERAGKEYTAYRYSDPELYATAFDALINNPSVLVEKAPEFTRSFFNYMGRKPEFKSAYDDIQNAFRSGTGGKTMVRYFFEGIKDAGKSVSGPEHVKEFIDAFRRDWRSAIRDVVGRLGSIFVRDYYRLPAQAKEARMWKQSLAMSPAFMHQWLKDFDTFVAGPIGKNPECVAFCKANEMDVMSLLDGYMFLRRAEGERSGMLSPWVGTGRGAEMTMNELRQILGDNATAVMDAVAERLMGIHLKTIETWAQGSGLYPEAVEQAILTNRDYVPFVSTDHLVEIYGKAMHISETPTSKIYQQKGGLAPLKRSVTVALFLKDAAIMRAAMDNMGKASLVETLMATNSGIQAAPVGRGEDGALFFKDPPKGSGKGLITVLDSGKAHGYWIDRKIADMYDHNPQVGMAASLLEWGTKGARVLAFPQRAAQVMYNPAFAVSNIIRDLSSTIVNMPGGVLESLKIVREMPAAIGDAVLTVLAGGMTPESLKSRRAYKMLPEQTRDWMMRAAEQGDPHYVRQLRENLGLPTYNRVGPGWAGGMMGTDLEHEMAQMLRHHLNETTMYRDQRTFFKTVGSLVTALPRLVEQFVNVSELSTKVAAARYLERRNPEMDWRDIAATVRDRAGTPNVMMRGTAGSMLNNIFIYSNVNMQGYVGMAQAAREDPKNYLFKMLVWGVLPQITAKTIKYGALGASGRGFQRLYQNVSDYILDNYYTIPLAMTEDHRTAALTVPMGYPQAFWGTVANTAMDQAVEMFTGKPSRNWIATLAQLMPYSKSRLPLWARHLYGITQALGDDMPYDIGAARDMITERDNEMGGADKAVAVARAMWNDYFGNSLYRIPGGNERDVNRDLEEGFKALGLPGLGPVLSRYVRVTNAGVAEMTQRLGEQKNAAFQKQVKLIVNSATRKANKRKNSVTAQTLIDDLATSETEYARTHGGNLPNGYTRESGIQRLKAAFKKDIEPDVVERTAAPFPSFVQDETISEMRQILGEEEQ